MRVALVLAGVLAAALFLSRDLDTRGAWRAAARARRQNVAAGLGPHGEPLGAAKGARPPRGTWLAIVYTSNGQGEIEPCG